MDKKISAILLHEHENFWFADGFAKDDPFNENYLGLMLFYLKSIQSKEEDKDRFELFVSDMKLTEFNSLRLMFNYALELSYVPREDGTSHLTSAIDVMCFLFKAFVVTELQGLKNLIPDRIVEPQILIGLLSQQLKQKYLHQYYVLRLVDIVKYL